MMRVAIKFGGFVPDTDHDAHVIDTVAMQNALVIIESAGRLRS